MGPPLTTTTTGNSSNNSGTTTTTTPTTIIIDGGGATSVSTTVVHLPSIRLRRGCPMRPPIPYRPPRVFTTTKQQQQQAQQQKLSWRTARLGLQPAAKQGKENSSNSSSNNIIISKPCATLGSFPRPACGVQGRHLEDIVGCERRPPQQQHQPQKQQQSHEAPTPRTLRAKAEIRPAACGTSAGTAAAAARRPSCRGPTFKPPPGAAQHATQRAVAHATAAGDDADEGAMGDRDSEELDEVEYLDQDQEERIVEWLRDVESCLRNGCSYGWGNPLESEDTSIKIVYGAS